MSATDNEISTSTEKPSSEPALARTMGLGALTIYGVGDMLGSGIYALIGKAAGIMGNAIWLAFLASMVGALLTGLSYASLGSRYPRAAGASYITHRAFGNSLLSYVIGLAVVASGLTSFATQARAFSGYMLGFLGLSLPGTTGATTPAASPALWIGIALCFILALSFINFWGMREAAWFNALCTAIEVGGLVLIIVIGFRFWGGVNLLEVPKATLPSPGFNAETIQALSLALVLQGAALTFFSFVGFEDMINVAEEVKDPRRNFPRAVILALAITTVIYIAISITAVSVVPHAELAKSGQPLVDVVNRAWPQFPIGLFSFIALFAIANTGLLNYIMGSRLVYGMARQGLLPAGLGKVHPTRRTPHRAILMLMVIVTVLALAGDIKQLASATSSLLLAVFILINASLIVLKRRPNEPKGAFEIPIIIPAGGIVACAAMLYHADRVALLIAAIMLAAIAALYAVVRPKAVIGETLS